MLQAIQALSASVTTASTGQTWPNVTIPDFEVHGINSNKISKALQVTFAPLIERGERRHWEAYSAHKLESSASVTETHDRRHMAEMTGTSAASSTTSAHLPSWIHGCPNDSSPLEATSMNSTGFGLWAHAPVWQQAPAPINDFSMINFDLLSHPVIAHLFRGVWEAQQAALSQALPLEFLCGGALQDDKHPHSILINPIYSSLKKDHHDQDDMVGLLVAVVSWEMYFSNILHDSNDGVVVVLDNACDEHFTYRIDGPEAIFLGRGDLHDPQYNALESRTPFAPFLKLNHSSSDEHCEYDLRMYPSTTLENRYITMKPIWYAFAINVIFIFTALTFLLFDYTVALRQRKVTAKAKRTHAIVSSLFPANVRDQLLHDAEEAEEQQQRKPRFLSNATQISNALGSIASNHNPVAPMGSKPIAHLYPSTTVMVG
jgi:CHASE domain